MPKCSPNLRMVSKNTHVFFYRASEGQEFRDALARWFLFGIFWESVGKKLAGGGVQSNLET